MWEDPIVNEVRQIRRQIEEECDDDFRKLYEHALEIQRQFANKRVKTSRRKPKIEKKVVAIK